MKALLFFLLLMIVTRSSLATVGQPIEESSTTEALAIGASTMLALGNLMMISGKIPSYWVGAVSVGTGLFAWSLAAQDPPSYGTGLWVSGLSAIATGAIALVYRRVLNEEKHARLEPAWTDGSPGLALVIDF